MAKIRASLPVYVRGKTETNFFRGQDIWNRSVNQSIEDFLPISGTAVLDFGAFPGSSDASVAVLGQDTITDDAIVHAFLHPVATADHSSDEHLVESIRVSAGGVVPGVGFTVVGLYDGPGDVTVYGKWTVAWSWS